MTQAPRGTRSGRIGPGHVGRIAITGTASFLGSRIVRRLADSRGPTSLVTIDLAQAPGTPPRVRHRDVDLTDPASDQHLLDVLRDEDVTEVVHLAFFTNPRRDSTYAHEVESIGTLHLMAAAAAAGVERVVLRSFTAVYGARGRNPNFLTERHPLHPNPSLGWVRDKVEAEEHAASFARRYPGMTVTALRMAPLLGPEVRNFYTRLLERRVLPVPMGYDPLLQLLHPDDALDALEAAVERGPGGPVNVVPRATITLRTLLHLAGKVPVAIPHPAAYAGADLLWAAGLGPAPSGFVDYVRYLCVADGEKAKEEMGFEARHGSRDALQDWLRYRYPRRRVRRRVDEVRA